MMNNKKKNIFLYFNTQLLENIQLGGSLLQTSEMQSKYDVKLTFWNHTSWSGVFSVVVADEVCQFCTELPDND